MGFFTNTGSDIPKYKDHETHERVTSDVDDFLWEISPQYAEKNRAFPKLKSNIGVNHIKRIAGQWNCYKCIFDVTGCCPCDCFIDTGYFVKMGEYGVFQ